MTYLGLDTSNYRTSVALYCDTDDSWQSHTRLLEVPAGTLGLRQSEALFQHTVRLHAQIAELPKGIGRNLSAVGVSTRPRAVEGSYMPCFLAGESVARSVAHLLDIPLVICSHQQGHLAAAALSAGALELLDQPFYAWHLSGGTTELVQVTPGTDGLPNAQRIGGSNDLSAGQLIDRTGQRLGLPFPSGAALEALSKQAESYETPFQPKVFGCEFSLSGVENKVQQLIERGIPQATIAQFVMETICCAVKKATEQAMKIQMLPLLCAGGVMSNKKISEKMKQHFEAYTADPQLSGDNAVGVAVLAARNCL